MSKESSPAPLRYARQVALAEIGVAGQARLARARVLVIGAGGLGAPALLYLAAAGIGTLGIADDDDVTISNLQRQILYRTGDDGRPKADAAAEHLRALNPEVGVEAHAVRIDTSNVVALIRDYDLVLDATDRLETKFLVNDAAAIAERPLIYGSALGFEAQVAIFDARRGPCLRCLFEKPPELPAPTCAEAGILGAVTGMAGSLQALEAVKWIVAGGSDNTLKSLRGRLWLLDGRTLATRVVSLPRDPACSICARPAPTLRLEREALRVLQLAPADLDTLSDALLIDVREEDEWNSGHLPGAIHVPLSSLLAEAPQLPARSMYVTYCTHGIRSQTAARLLLQAGFRRVYSLSGGLAALTENSWRADTFEQPR